MGRPSNPAELVMLPVRLQPGDDLRASLEAQLAHHGCDGAFVLCGVGSLSVARLRAAGAAQPRTHDGDWELLTLSGSLSTTGAHLHASIADSQGATLGGHVGYGCRVRTTAEVLIGLLPAWHFSREADPATGHAELVLRRKTRAGDGGTPP